MTNTTQRFFDDGPDAICIADADFMVQHVNGAFERLLGYTRDELRGIAPVEHGGRFTLGDGRTPDDPT